MPDTIFYSWQSDSPNSTNRGFIEKALQTAIKELGAADEELYEARREVELDKDTKGVSGSPPIAETIFKKIEDCSVFVADMTFVGSTPDGRPIPNPNVLIEYGWALAKAGHNRIITVMNCAFGEPDEASLPFDLRHHAWPIRYTVPEDADQETKARERGGLAKTLAFKIGEVLHSEGEKNVAPNETALVPKDRVSSFLGEGDTLCRVRDRRGLDDGPATPIVWSDGPQIFIRLVPDRASPRKNLIDLKELLQASPVPLLGNAYGVNIEGNEHGVVLFEVRGGDEFQTEANRIVKSHNLANSGR